MLAFKGKNKALNFGFVGCFLVFCMSQLTSTNVVCLMLSSDYVCLAVLLYPERAKFWPTGSSV